MLLYDLIMETAIGQLIVFIGCAMGFFAAIDSDWKDTWRFELLSYNNYHAQIINRVLFTLGAILCLFVDFPSRSDWAGKSLNFIMFPFLGFICMCLAWALTYNALRVMISVIRWCFEKKH